MLKLSNIKRAVVAPRAGRVGLPDNAPDSTADVDCTAYHQLLLSDKAMQARDQPHKFLGSEDHSWYIGNRVFTRDLFETLKGDLDRSIIAARSPIPGSRRLSLVGK